MTKKSRNFRKAKREIIRKMRLLDNRYTLCSPIGFKFIDFDSVSIHINSPGGNI